MPLKSALLRDFGGCCFCSTIRACFLWLLEVTFSYYDKSILKNNKLKRHKHIFFMWI